MDFGTKIKITVTGDCKNPIITLLGNDSTIEVNCINASCGEYEVQVNDDLGTKCFTFKVECSNCKDCPPQIITKCLCTTNSDCPNKCDFCDSGVCNPKPCVAGCEDGTCLDDCIECVTNCTDGKICQSYIRSDGRECKKCVCPVGKFINSFGDCVSCIKDSDCGPCKVCDGAGNCIPKDCGTGACNPTTNTCVECVNSGNCGVNEQCVNNKCECIPGYCKNAAGVCEPCPCITDEDCGSCGVCKNKICVPKQCPNGQICDNGECKPLCDCNNPTSCGSGKVCKNKGSYCVCESCGSCENGCAEGCINKCGKGEGCQPNPCTGSCENGGQCGPNCGCNPITKKCEPCSEVTCGTNCGSLLGCKCAGVTCEKDNTCSGTCNDSFDCGPNCTCYLGKCVPCSFFSCTDCANQERCKCNGSCQGDPSAKCNDVLELNIVGCTIEGKLSTSKSCPCPVITAKINNTTSDFSSTKQRYVFDLELFKGVTTESKYRLDQTSTPGIADNELPIGGSFVINITVFYKVNNVLESSNTSQLMSLSGQGIGILGNKLTFDLDKFGINLASSQEQLEGKTKFVDRIVFEAYVNEANFPNTCEYVSSKIGEKIVVSNLAKFETTNLISSPGFKVPLFTWFKSEDGNFSTKLKDIYPTLVGESWADVLEAPEAESCFSYNLIPDCGCADSKSKRVVFCSPISISVTFKQCNTLADINVLAPCDANINKTYSIYAVVKGQTIPVASKVILPYKSTYTSSSGPISRIFMKMDCDSQNLCEWSKDAPATPFTEVAASTKCSGDMPVFEIKNTLLDYVTWSKDAIKHFADPSGSVILQGESGKKYTFTAYFKGGCAPFSGETPIGEYCNDAYKVSAVENCNSNNYTFTNLKTDSNVEYSLDPSFTVLKTKSQLEALTIVTTPTILYWRVKETSIQGNTSLPTKTVCCDNTFLVERVPGSNQLEVRVTNVSSSTISVNLVLNSTPHTLTNILSGSTSSYTFSPVTGAYTLTASKIGSSCDVKTYTGTIGSCSLPLTTGSTGCSLTAKVTGTPNCECKSLDWEVKIINVQKLQDVLVIQYESQIKYKDAEVVSGTLIAQANTDFSTYSQNLGAKGFNSGVLEIPCIPTTNVVLVKDANFVAYSDPVNPVVKFYNVSFSGYTVQSFKVNGVELPYIVNAYEYYTSEPYSSEYLMEITLKNDATNDIVTGDFGVDEEIVDIGLGATKIVYFDIVGSVTNCPTVSTLRFSTENIELEDGCKYTSTPFEFVVNTNYSVTPSTKTQTLNKVLGSTRKIKYTWAENGLSKKTEFKSSGVDSSYAGSVSNPLSLTKQYRALAECDCNSDSVVVQSCLNMPTFSAWSIVGNTINFTISNTGCYITPIVVTVDNGDPAQTIVNYNPNNINTGSIVLSAPIQGQVNLVGKYQDNLGCSFTQVLTANTYEVVPSFVTCATGGCAAGTYIWKAKVKRNGVFIPHSEFTLSTLPARTIVVDADGFSRKVDVSTCAVSTTVYTYTVVVDGVTKTGTFQNNCSVACTLNENSVAFTTDPAVICDNATTVRINKTFGPAGTSYQLNGAGPWVALGAFFDYTIPVPGVTPSLTISVREDANPTCVVDKTVQFFYGPCEVDEETPIPPPNCNLSANNSTSAKFNVNFVNLTGILSSANGYIYTLADIVKVSNGDTVDITIQDIVGGISLGRTYTWSVFGGATAGVIPSTATTSLTLTSFTGNTFFIGCLVTDTVSAGNTCSRFYSVEIGKLVPSCPIPGDFPYPVPNGIICCNPSKWTGSICCPTPLCGPLCCDPGKVCNGLGQCVTPGSSCPGADSCYKYDLLGNCTRECTSDKYCCAVGDCRSFTGLALGSIGLNSVCYDGTTASYGVGLLLSFYYPSYCPGFVNFLSNTPITVELVYNGSTIVPITDFTLAYTSSNGGTILLSRHPSLSNINTVIASLTTAQVVVKNTSGNIIVTKTLTIGSC